MKTVKIAVDMSSGDSGISATMPAVLRFLQTNPNVELYLVGKKDEITPKIPQDKLSRVKVIHAEQVVEMDDKPVQALRFKKDSSLRLAVDLVKDKVVDICVSSGNTGALMATAHTRLKTLPNVDRPAIMGSFPNAIGKDTFLLDLGANVSATSDNLFQFGVLAAALLGSDENLRPRVSLLNIGHEEIKGTKEVKEAAAMLESCPNIDFVGYTEGDKIFFDDVDIIVCDGFVGNIMLKACEGMVKVLYNKILTSVKKKPLMAFITKKFLKYILSFTFGNYKQDKINGAIFIGLNGLVVKSHGNANEDAFYNALQFANRTVMNFCLERYSQKLASIMKPKVSA